MNRKQSKYLRAILFPNDLLEVGLGATRSQCFTVQDYHYRCYRERDEQGNPYDGIRSGYLEFSVIAGSLENCRFFYQCMEQPQNTPVSFVFNATYSETGRLTDYEDGLVTYGYVVDVEESCLNDDDSGEEQLLIHVRMLLSNMVVMGHDKVHLLEITKD